MKKGYSALCLALAAAMAASVGVSAASAVTKDDFSDYKKAENWTVDNYAPQDFDYAEGRLYLAVGPDGFRANRDDEAKAKSYAMQGRRLKCERPSSTSWSATIRLNVESTWYGARDDKEVKQRLPELDNKRIVDNKKKVVFGVQLVGESGSRITFEPAISLVKGGDGVPMFNYAG